MHEFEFAGKAWKVVSLNITAMNHGINEHVAKIGEVIIEHSRTQDAIYGEDRYWYSMADLIEVEVKSAPDSITAPFEPTEDQWGGFARTLIRYMEMNERLSPVTLKKHINRFVGMKNIPDWVNAEVKNWESDHHFAAGDLATLIYKAMLYDYKS